MKSDEKDVSAPEPLEGKRVTFTNQCIAFVVKAPRDKVRTIKVSEEWDAFLGERHGVFFTHAKLLETKTLLTLLTHTAHLQGKAGILVWKGVITFGSLGGYSLRGNCSHAEPFTVERFALTGCLS